MNILKDKTIQVFDTELFQKGTLITLEFTRPGDEGEVESDGFRNGIVIKATETEINYVYVSKMTGSVMTGVITFDLLNERYPLRVVGVKENAL